MYTMGIDKLTKVEGGGAKETLYMTSKYLGWRRQCPKVCPMPLNEAFALHLQHNVFENLVSI